MAQLENIRNAVINMEVEKTVELVKKALEEEISAEKILDEGLVPAMDVVGGEYEKGERFIPEMLRSAEAMKNAMEILKPLLAEADVEPKGKVIIGTVEGDLHDIGQQLVSMLLEGAGFEVTNLGSETPSSKFVQAVKDYKPDIVGMSALLTTTMTRMPEVVSALEEAGVRGKVKVLIGGAPVTQEYADKIGADGYGEDAAAAVRMANSLIN